MLDPDKTFAEQRVAPHDRAGLAPAHGSALEKRIRDAMALSESCKDSYAKNGHGSQYSYARGQIDSFQAVLNWMSEAPNNDYPTSG